MNRRRLAAEAWPLLQVSLAVTLAWLIANLLHGRENPFFAPIAAAVALTGPRGERGLQAVRLLTGVIAGISTGDVVVASMGLGYGRLAIATFVAMALATGIGGTRTVITQAASSAILTVIAAAGEAGVHRLVDALIGGGVALIFSQVVFSPEPVALLRRAETDALSRIARGLRLTADALDRGDEALGEQAVETLRALRDVGELARLRTAAKRVARHSAVWRSQVDAVVREQEHADYLDLVASGSVMLARMALAAKPPGRAQLATRIRELSAVIGVLAETPGDRDTRQRAADDALHSGRPIESDAAATDEAAVVALAVLRIVARDVMLFAGLTVDQAEAAIRAGEAEHRVPAPPAMPRVPFGLDRRHREGRRSSSEPRRGTPDTPDDHPKQ